MDHAHKTSLGPIAVACCLAACLSGCLQPPLGHRLANRWRVHPRFEAGFPMEAQIDPTATAGIATEELVYSEHNCQSACGPLCKLRCVGQRLFWPHRWAAEPGVEVAPLPEPLTHEAIAADTCGEVVDEGCDEELVYPEDECESCGGPLAGLRCRLCGSRGRLRGDRKSVV